MRDAAECKNWLRKDISLGVAIGSSTQISMFGVCDVSLNLNLHCDVLKLFYCSLCHVANAALSSTDLESAMSE
ncbi:hypothetical protein SDJN02_23230 [Cucurbita argyrosperma subsp. argyrosperma]|nr:hypothetical protein SDJN02_23230 [Cucurbita argyrosperma subsp. argyrosperma]